MRTPSQIIQSHMEIIGWSQLELSRKSKVSRQNIGLWCLGKTTPGGEGLFRVATAMNLSREETIELAIACAADRSPDAELWEEIARRSAAPGNQVDPDSPFNPQERKIVDATLNLWRGGTPRERNDLTTLLAKEAMWRRRKARKAAGK